MTMLYACRISDNCFTTDIEFNRSESKLREGGLNHDQLQVFHLPAKDLGYCQDFVRNRLYSLGYSVDDKAVCFYSAAWDMLRLLVDEYITQNLEYRTLTPYPVIRHIQR